MRIGTSVTAISWIPSEAISSMSLKAPFEMGVAHYDEPLPDHIDDITALRDADKFRFANVLRAWIDVSDAGKILGLEPAAEEQAPQEEIPFRVGQVVEVMEGPFSDFSGTVQEVDADKGKVKVEVSLFGRPTSVELDYTQLKGY